MEHSPVSIEDLAYHDPNAGENALWNINLLIRNGYHIIMKKSNGMVVEISM